MVVDGWQLYFLCSCRIRVQNIMVGGHCPEKIRAHMGIDGQNMTKVIVGQANNSCATLLTIYIENNCVYESCNYGA